MLLYVYITLTNANILSPCLSCWPMDDELHVSYQLASSPPACLITQQFV